MLIMRVKYAEVEMAASQEQISCALNRFAGIMQE